MEEWDPVQTGNTSLQRHLATRALTSESVAPAMIVAAGPQAGQLFTFEREAILGRHPDCPVYLSAPDVSRRHARVFVTRDEQFRLEDLGSHNMTLVNGHPVLKAALRFGDRVQLGGETILLFTHWGRLEHLLVHERRMSLARDLSAGVAHHINNMLAVIRSNTEHLQGSDKRLPLGDSDVEAVLEEVMTATTRAAEVSRQLVSFARKRCTQSLPVHLSSLLSNCARQLSGALNPGVTLESKIEPHLVVKGVRAQLEQVVLQLCDNAQNAMAKGGALRLRAVGRSLMAEDAEQAPAMRVGAPIVEVAIEDSGAGITAETHRQLFEPFFTTDEQRVGLGLTAVQGILDSHGGIVRVNSERGRGTTFRLLFPRYLSASDREPPPTVDSAVALGREVLIVDPDGVARGEMRGALEGLRYAVKEANNGAEAVTAFRQNGHAIGLVIIDSALVSPGVEPLVSALRTIDSGARIVLSSLDSADRSQVEALQLGGFLLKPLEPATCRDAFTRMLEGGPALLLD